MSNIHSELDHPLHKLWLHKSSSIPPERNRQLGVESLHPTPEESVPEFATRRDFLDRGIEVLGTSPECDICYNKGTLAARIRKCGHYYCVPCLTKCTLNSETCPSCRTRLFESRDEDSDDYFVYPPVELFQEYPHECPQTSCGKTFRTRWDLEVHCYVESNHSIFPWRTDASGNIFMCFKHPFCHLESRDQLKAHFAVLHTFSCPYCDWEPDESNEDMTAQLLRDHVHQEHHFNAIRCAVCNDVFTDFDSYLAHKIAEKIAWQREAQNWPSEVTHLPESERLRSSSQSRYFRISFAVEKMYNEFSNESGEQD